MGREHAFEQTVVAYLRVYHAHAAAAAPAVEAAPRASDSIEAYVRHTDLTAQRRTGIVDEFLAETSRAPPKVAMAARDVCPRCADGVSLLLCAARGIMSCPRCGYQVAFLDATSSTFDEVTSTRRPHKRINHYLATRACREGGAPRARRHPRGVMADLHDRQGVRRPEEITQRRVRETLRRLRLRKAYDHVAQVAHRLSGIRPPRLAPAVEEQLRNLFLQMQPAFHRHAPKSRTNFLSYSYVLYRSFQILGLHHMLDGVTLLKGRDKLEANDAIFRKMSEDLGGPYTTAASAETMGRREATRLPRPSAPLKKSDLDRVKTQTRRMAPPEPGRGLAMRPRHPTTTITLTSVGWIVVLSVIGCCCLLPRARRVPYAPTCPCGSLCVLLPPFCPSSRLPADPQPFVLAPLSPAASRGAEHARPAAPWRAWDHREKSEVHFSAAQGINRCPNACSPPALKAFTANANARCAARQSFRPTEDLRLSGRTAQSVQAPRGRR